MCVPQRQVAIRAQQISLLSGDVVVIGAQLTTTRFAVADGAASGLGFVFGAVIVKLETLGSHIAAKH